MANATGPQMAYYGQQMGTFGYPEGMTVVDFVPETIKHMVHEHWYNYPPVNPMWHYLLGVIYIFLGFFSTTGNGLVIYLYMKAPNSK
nr:compound eye opsin BCRH1-like [Penaeus vannamei]